MSNKIVDLDPARGPAQRPATDFWFAQLDVRLSKIEFVIARLEKQVWLIVCAIFATVITEVFRLLMSGS